MFSGKPSLASLAIAQKCEEVIFEYGHSAYEAIKTILYLHKLKQ